MDSQSWRCGSWRFPWGERTLIMGVLNVTPDSFSDGGAYDSTSRAIAHAVHLTEVGADIIDVGGESTRPGAQPVPVEEECRRVVPVVSQLASEGLCVSIDTTHAETARRCLDAGAVILNDISGLQNDPQLAALSAEYGAGLCMMHMRGTPQTMQTQTGYSDVVAEVSRFLGTQMDFAIRQGVDRSCIAVDPGIGFSKTGEQNLQLLNRLPEAVPAGVPVLVGVSRKSFLGHITGKAVDEREWATASAVSASILKGAHIVRVHAVAEMKDVVMVADAIRQASFADVAEV